MLRDHSEQAEAPDAEGPEPPAAAAAAADRGPPPLASASRSSSSRSGRRCACNRMRRSSRRRFGGSCCASVCGRVYRSRRSQAERCCASGRRDPCRPMRRRRWRRPTRERSGRPSGPSPPGCARRASSRSSMAALHAAAQGDHPGLALWPMVSRLGQTDIWTLAAGPAGKSHARDAHPMYRICYAVARYDLI